MGKREVTYNLMRLSNPQKIEVAKRCDLISAKEEQLEDGELITLILQRAEAHDKLDDLVRALIKVEAEAIDSQSKLPSDHV